jgi:hypothetical protein
MPYIFIFLSALSPAPVPHRLIYEPVAEHRYVTMRAEREAKNATDSAPVSPSKPAPKLLPRSVTSLNKIHWEPAVQELRLLSREMLAMVQSGSAAPDTEGTKPRPWTIMMCAAAINDTDTMKRLLREGCDVNCGNKSGTTALMVASQLNVVDSIAFLLQNGADLNQVDMHGHPAMAYATSLPLPAALSESFSSFMSDGDTEFAKRLNAAKLLKLAAGYGSKGLNSVLDNNVLETGPQEKAEWVRYHSLLETHGLSRIETNWQLQNSIKNASNRLGGVAGEVFQAGLPDDSESETESELADRDAYLALLETKRLAREHQEHLETLRCPICTLLTPCPHFLNPITLSKLIEGGYKPPPKVSIIRDGSILTKKQVAFLTERVLRESGLDDRKTDRTLTRLRDYQKRITQLDKEKAALLLEAAEHAETLEQEAQAVLRIEAQAAVEVSQGERGRRGGMGAVVDAQALVALEWRQEIDDYGRIMFINQQTKERWTMHISITPEGDAKAYYYNNASDTTQWEPPGSLAGLSLEALSGAFPTSGTSDGTSGGTGDADDANGASGSGMAMSGSLSMSMSVDNTLNGSGMPAIMPATSTSTGAGTGALGEDGKPKKKKKKGGVKFSFADDVDVKAADIADLNDTAASNADADTDTGDGGSSSSAGVVDKKAEPDSGSDSGAVVANDTKATTTTTTTTAPDTTTPPADAPAPAASTAITTPLVSALKSGEIEIGTGGVVKKKKRVGGIRFNDEEQVKTFTASDCIGADLPDANANSGDTATTTAAGAAGSGNSAAAIAGTSVDTNAGTKADGDAEKDEVKDKDPKELALPSDLPIIETESKTGTETEIDTEVETEAETDAEAKTENEAETEAKAMEEDEHLDIGDELGMPPVQPLPPNERRIFSFTKNSSLGSRTVDSILPRELTTTIRGGSSGSSPPRGSSSTSGSVDSSSRIVSALPPPAVEYPVFVSGAETEYRIFYMCLCLCLC